MIGNIKIALVSFILAMLLFFCNREKNRMDHKGSITGRIKMPGGYLLVLSESTEKNKD